MSNNLLKLVFFYIPLNNILMKNLFVDAFADPSKDYAYNLLYHDFPILHNHNYWEFLIVLSGEYKHTINGKEELINRGQIIVVKPDDYHMLVQNSKSASHLNIMAKCEAIEKWARNYSDAFYESLFKGEINISMNDVYINKIETYCLLYNNSDEQKQQLIMNYITSLILTNVIDQFFNVVDDKPKWLLDLIAEMHRQENISWTVSDVVSYSNFSHVHLIREFKKYFDCSIVEYLRKVKISFATDYLKHSNLSISEISFLLGFSSVSHLNHIFKETTGKTPLQYRKDYLSKKGKAARDTL